MLVSSRRGGVRAVRRAVSAARRCPRQRTLIAPAPGHCSVWLPRGRDAPSTPARALSIAPPGRAPRRSDADHAAEASDSTSSTSHDVPAAAAAASTPVVQSTSDTAADVVVWTGGPTAGGDSDGSDAGDGDGGEYREEMKPQPPWNVFFTKQYWREVRAALQGMPDPPGYQRLELSKLTAAEHRAVWAKTLGDFTHGWLNVRGGGGGRRRAGDDAEEELDPEDAKAEIAEQVEGAKEIGKKIGAHVRGNVQQNMEYLRSEEKDRDMQELKGYVEDKMDMYREALQAFLAGYREGKEAPENFAEGDFRKFMDEAMDKGRTVAAAAARGVNAAVDARLDELDGKELDGRAPAAGGGGGSSSTRSTTSSSSSTTTTSGR